MDNLYKGIHKFQSSYYQKNKELFKKLSKGQQPEVFFITCVDSRIDPNLITMTGPGEMLILRNAGNIVPPFDAEGDKNSVASALEFAVLALKVKNIVICGHSDCGAMKALRKDEKDLDGMPHLRDWLKIASPVRNFMTGNSDAKIQRSAEEKNIVVQLQNMLTYPFVREAALKGRLNIYGWYYEIATGSIYEYNPDTGLFKKAGG